MAKIQDVRRLVAVRNTPRHGRRGYTLFVAAAVVVSTALLLGQVGVSASEVQSSETQNASCAGTQIRPDDDLDRIVNGDPIAKPTTFCLASGTYVLSSAITLNAGDSLVGPEGRKVTKGPATYGVPTARITDGDANLPRLITLGAGASRLEWLELYGADGAYTSESKEQCANWGDVANKCPRAGTGMAVGAGQTDGSILMRYLYVHGNDSLGIGSAKGRILNSHFTDNTSNPDWLGFEAAAIKGVDEFEAANNYIHGEQGNGIWCDHGCEDVPVMQNGFWVHDNLVVNNGRWGVRYEYSPRFTDEYGQDDRIDPRVTALVERNRVHGNGRESGHNGGGMSMEDAQNGMFRENRFGPARIGDSRFRTNVDGLALRFSWSNRPDRTDLRNGTATRNVLRGERIEGCTKPESVVHCADNLR